MDVFKVYLLNPLDPDPVFTGSGCATKTGPDRTLTFTFVSVVLLVQRPSFLFFYLQTKQET